MANDDIPPTDSGDDALFVLLCIYILSVLLVGIGGYILGLSDPSAPHVLEGPSWHDFCKSLFFSKPRPLEEEAPDEVIWDHRHWENFRKANEGALTKDPHLPNLPVVIMGVNLDQLVETSREQFEAGREKIRHLQLPKISAADCMTSQVKNIVLIGFCFTWKEFSSQSLSLFSSFFLSPNKYIYTYNYSYLSHCAFLSHTLVNQAQEQPYKRAHSGGSSSGELSSESSLSQDNVRVADKHRDRGVKGTRHNSNTANHTHRLVPANLVGEKFCVAIDMKLFVGIISNLFFQKHVLVSSLN